MPHDGLDDGTRTTVVQAIVGTREAATQATAPERRGAAPARTDIVSHEEAVLNQISVWPDGLVGILGQHLAGILANLLGIGLGAGINPHIDATSGPRWAVAIGATNLAEQLFSALYIGIVQITGSRHSQSAVPHHKLVVLLVAHLVYPILGRAIKQILLEGILVGHRWGVEHLVNTVSDTLVGTIGIVRIQDAGGR